jgi:hypothetical protein
MSLRAELRNTDAVKATNIFADTFGASDVTRPGFLAVEFIRTVEYPIFSGIEDGFESVLAPRLEARDIPERRIKDLQVGIELCRVAVGLYVASETPDQL